MIRNVLAQLFIEGTPAVFSQSLSFSFLLLRKDHLMSAQDTSMGRLFVVLLNHWQNSLVPYYISLWLGNPWPKQPPIKAARGYEVRQLAGLGGKAKAGRILGPGVRTVPQPLLSLGGPFLMGWRELVGRSRSRGRRASVHWTWDHSVSSGGRRSLTSEALGILGRLVDKSLYCQWAVWCQYFILTFKDHNNLLFLT